jgi:nicotinamide-nucleotide amidase
MIIHTIATGTELMLGLTADQDFQLMAAQLGLSGIPISRHCVVGDDLNELETVFRQALNLADIVIMTGGLGPTTDDLTRDIASKILKRSLCVNEDVLNDITKKFTRRHLELPESAKQQALILDGAVVIPNRVGTAPGMHIEKDKKNIFLLPGPPFEMQSMFEGYVLPFLKSKVGKDHLTHFLELRTFAIRESSVQELMNREFEKEPQFLKSIGYCSAPRGVDVRIFYKEAEFEKTRALYERLKKVLNPWLYAEGLRSLHEITAELLLKENLSLAVAESCTGGLIAHRLTAVPGISKVFKLGVVSYSNDSKTEVLGVPAIDIEKNGAVSEIVALRMAEGVRKKARSNLGISVTGISGPDGGTAEKPVGLIWIGLADEETVFTKSFQFVGTREVIQFKASQAVLDVLRRYLLKKPLEVEEIS